MARFLPVPGGNITLQVPQEFIYGGNGNACHLGLSQLFFFLDYFIQNFSKNAPISPKDLPHYSQIFPNVSIEI